MSKRGKLPWPGWLWRKYEVVTSPSMLMVYDECPTQWWFKKVLRLPEREDEKQFLFGNALHAVAAEWHRKGGEDVYPAGWDEGLTPAEMQQVKDMVEMAASQGLWRRRGGVEVERSLWTELIPEKVALIMTLDVIDDEGVEDHKTVSSMKWLPTVEKLREDPKMLSYARMWQRHTGRGEGAGVRLRLNCLGKREPFAIPVETVMTAAEVDEWWRGTAVPIAERMLADSAKHDRGQVEKDDSGRACRRYFGCPFIDVCTGEETVPQYRERLKS